MAEEPLIPRSASGIGLAAILLTGVMTSLGFLGQKALDLDEKVVMLQEQQRDDEEANTLIHEISVKVANIETVQANRLKVVDLVVKLDEDINRMSATLEALLKDVDRLRDAE